jgi:hypothetical protein
MPAPPPRRGTSRALTLLALQRAADAAGQQLAAVEVGLAVSQAAAVRVALLGGAKRH